MSKILAYFFILKNLCFDLIKIIFIWAPLHNYPVFIFMLPRVLRISTYIKKIYNYSIKFQFSVLQVNWVQFNVLQVNLGIQYRDFTKSLIFPDFDDVLKHPFGYVHLFLLIALLSKKKIQNSPCMMCNRPYKMPFLGNQFHLSETLETWSVSRSR